MCPLMITAFFNIDLGPPRNRLILDGIYYLQFSTNFFIYAARSQQYRQSYLYILNLAANYLNIFVICKKTELVQKD